MRRAIAWLVDPAQSYPVALAVIVYLLIGFGCVVSSRVDLNQRVEALEAITDSPIQPIGVEVDYLLQSGALSTTGLLDNVEPRRRGDGVVR